MELLWLAGKWIEFDDDNPKPKVEEDITRLSGGGKDMENYFWVGYYDLFNWFSCINVDKIA